jgi:hypothetical protein
MHPKCYGPAEYAYGRQVSLSVLCRRWQSGVFARALLSQAIIRDIRVR